MSEQRRLESTSTISSRSGSNDSSYRLESVNSEMSNEDLVVPSLGLDELEGRIHPYEGPLEYKPVGKLGALKSWKRRWFKVTEDNRRPNIYHLLKSKSTLNTASNVHRRLLTVPRSHPNIYIDTFGKDPSNKDFLSFNVCNTATGDVLCMFRAENVVQQRNFMAALGGKGPGLFTQNSDDTLEISVLPDGPPTSELFTRQRSYDMRSNRHRSTRNMGKVPSYLSTMAQLSREFYLPEGSCQTIMDTDYPGESLPVYTSFGAMRPIGPCKRRPENDTFLPPHGAPVYSPVSLGYGAEVGLEPSQQAIWVPENNFYYFLDHKKKTSFLEDPRPLPPPMAVVNQKQLVYTGSCDEQTLKDLCPALCKDPQVIEATSKRAAGKPTGFVLRAHGGDGAAGRDGANGVCGMDGEDGLMGKTFEHTFGADGKSGTSGSRGTDGMPGTPGECMVVLSHSILYHSTTVFTH